MALWTPLDLGAKLIDWWDASYLPSLEISPTIRAPNQDSSAPPAILSWQSRGPNGAVATARGGLNTASGYYSATRSIQSGISVVQILNASNDNGFFFPTTGYPTGSTPGVLAITTNTQYRGGKIGLMGYGDFTQDGFREICQYEPDIGAYRNDNNELNATIARNYNPRYNGSETFLDIEGGASSSSMFRINGQTYASLTRTINTTIANNVGVLGSHYQYQTMDGWIYHAVSTFGLTEAEYCRLEGFLVWACGSAYKLPNAHPYRYSPPIKNNRKVWFYS